MTVGWRRAINAGTALAFLISCSPAQKGPAPTMANQPAIVRGAGEIIALPAPRREGSLSLEEALSARRSARSYGSDPLTLSDIGQLFWAAQGVTHRQGYRTAPSAGALYPLEVYAATDNGLYHYLPDGHKAELQVVPGWRAALCDAALGQQAVCAAPAVFIVAAVYERTAAKYGERAERYVRLEAGHAAQNLLLQAVALELGAVPIGAFYDDQVQAALSLPVGQEPLYLIPVGR